MSALATIVGSMGELSESELRQLYLMIGVRLGIPDVPVGAKPQKTGAGKASNAKPSTAKGGKKAPSSKGNPKRKSQWANHPLYQEYSRLKKVVEAQAKEAKTSFNAVSTGEARAYREAFSHWLEAKSTFRDHREDGTEAATASNEKKQDAEDASEEEDEDDESPTSPTQPSAVPPPTKPSASGNGRSFGVTGITGGPKGKGKVTGR